jgi:hypothetical protein
VPVKAPCWYCGANREWRKTAQLGYAVEAARGFRVLRTIGVEWEMELPFAALDVAYHVTLLAVSAATPIGLLRRGDGSRR